MRRPILMIVVYTGLFGCAVKDPLYCDENTPCTNPALPFCDVDGEFPASEGIKRTCIPDPNPDAGPYPDAGVDRRVVRIAVGAKHTCAVTNDGALRCWGWYQGLGYAYGDSLVTGDNLRVGDDEHPFEAGDVPTGGFVKDVAAGLDFTCALYDGGGIRCWGANDSGQLGYGDTEPRSGEGQYPAILDEVSVGGPVSQVVCGESFACALLESNEVRCWGNNEAFQLATFDTENVGDNELPTDRLPIDIGGTVLTLTAGAYHVCALLEGGFVRCWGDVFNGPLGYGDDQPVGDDETPDAAGDINIGGRAKQLAAAGDHTCAVLEDGAVRCWGNGSRDGSAFQDGILGYKEIEDIGDTESPASAGDVLVGGIVEEVSGTTKARCTRMDDATLRCWGAAADSGVLGQGDMEPIGDDEFPNAVGTVKVGGAVSQLATASGAATHMCALMQSGDVRCWGLNSDGALGLATDYPVGDDEEPDSFSAVRVLE